MRKSNPYNTADYLDSEEGDAADIRSALGKDGNPTLATLLAVTRALGVKLSVAA